MTDTPTTCDARILGSLRQLSETSGVVRVEDVYETDIVDLWSALTDPDRLRRWIATVEGDLRLGGRIHARFTSGWEGPGRIDVCDAPQRLLVTMEPDTAEETVIEAELTAVGVKSRLVVEERGISLREIAAHGAGWQAHLEDLASYLDGRTPGEWRARWTELTPTYEELGKAGLSAQRGRGIES